MASPRSDADQVVLTEASSVSSDADSVQLVNEPAGSESSPRKGIARHVFVVAILCAVVAGSAVAVFLSTHKPSSIDLPDRFTVKFNAYNKKNTSVVEMTGELYKVPAPSGSSLSWHSRALASMPAAGGVQTRRITVIDDQGVQQTLHVETGAVISTKCADDTHVASISSVVDAAHAGTAVSEEDMLAVVGGGACEGPGLSRFLVQVGSVPFVVCWAGSFDNVVVSGEDFFAVLDFMPTVNDADMETISMPEAATAMNCPLFDHSSSRRLASPRRLCEDCGGSWPPPHENCCSRRLDGSLDVRPVAMSPHRHAWRSLSSSELATCNRSSKSNTKECVFVHGLMVEEGGSPKMTGNFRSYWGEVKQYVSPFCTSVSFVKMNVRDEDILDPSVANHLCNLISETTPGNNPNLIKDTLVFAHGAANIILANGKVTGACQLHSTSRWFEIQSQFSLSRLAQWGEHFCAVESMPPSSPGKTDLEKFSEMYPLCRPSSGRRLAIGQGVLDRAWEQVAYDPTLNWGPFRDVIINSVSGYMCAMSPGKAAPSIKFESILSTAWNRQYDPYPKDGVWSNCFLDSNDLPAPPSNEVVADWRSTKYGVEGSLYDATCRAGNNWYDGTINAAKPCSWYQQMACLYGDESRHCPDC